MSTNPIARTNSAVTVAGRRRRTAAPVVSRREGDARTSRRTFLGGSLAVGGVSLVPAGAFAAGEQRLRVGLVGCGGRGTGAALQAAAADPTVRVVALGDMFADQVATAAHLLGRGIGGQFDCPPERRFVGEMAFLEVIRGDVDLVLLAAPPHVRPLHLEAAIAAGRHVYCEKPVAVDAAGVVRAAAAALRGREAGLSLVSGFCFRHDSATVALIERVRGGEIGRPVSLRAHAAIGLPWWRPPVSGDAAGAWRLRNWISFTALSGGHFVEHHVEAIDRAVWLMGDTPPCTAEPLRSTSPDIAVAVGVGDCVPGTAVRYRFADGGSLDASLDRRVGCRARRLETVTGTRGSCDIVRGAIGGAVVGPPPGGPGRHQAAMSTLVQSVLSGEFVHEGTSMCLSTMTAVMGRAAAAAGRRITWDDCAGTAVPSAPPV
jgi:myo-inositol 2-dehydrogenase/D-chiro-inositol 1-dehydrogenase